MLRSSKKLRIVYPVIMWKAELINNELGYLVEDDKITQQKTDAIFHEKRKK